MQMKSILRYIVMIFDPSFNDNCIASGASPLLLHYQSTQSNSPLHCQLFLLRSELTLSEIVLFYCQLGNQ